MPNVAALLVLLVACRGESGEEGRSPSSASEAASVAPVPSSPPLPPPLRKAMPETAPAVLAQLQVPPSHSGYVPHAEYLRYDELDRAGTLGGIDAIALAALALGEGMGVAEIGCGPAPAMREFAARVGPTGRVYEVDVDPNAIQFVRARLLRAPTLYGAPLDNVTVVQSTFDDVRLPPGSIDRAFLQQVHNYAFLPTGMPPDAARARYERENLAFTRSVHAALRPGGRMVVVEMPRSVNTGADFGRADIRRFVEGTGYFRFVEEVEEVYETSYLLGFERIDAPAAP